MDQLVQVLEDNSPLILLTITTLLFIQVRCMYKLILDYNSTLILLTITTLLFIQVRCTDQLVLKVNSPLILLTITMHPPLHPGVVHGSAGSRE